MDSDETRPAATADPAETKRRLTSEISELEGAIAMVASGSASAAVAQLGAAERAPRPKLSKEAYRRRKSQLDEDLAHLNARKRQLEEALQDPSVHGNFVELRRVSGDGNL